MSFLRPLAAALALAVGFATMTLPAPAAEPLDKKAVEAIIREYLINNPEVLIEAMQAYKKRQQDESEQETLASIKRYRNDLFDDPNSFVVGNPNGKLTMVEFFDYRCGYCKQARPSVADLLKRDDNVRLVLKEFPILGPESVTASRAAIAAFIGQRDKYWAYHEALYDYKGRLSDESIIQIAQSVGLDVAKLKTDMTSSKVDKIIEDNRKLAEALNISGTPAFIIGNQFLPGAAPVDTLMAAVKEARRSCDFC